MPLADPVAVERYATAQGNWWTLRFLLGERRVLYGYALANDFTRQPLAGLDGMPLDGGTSG